MPTLLAKIKLGERAMKQKCCVQEAGLNTYSVTIQLRWNIGLSLPRNHHLIDEHRADFNGITRIDIIANSADTRKHLL